MSEHDLIFFVNLYYLHAKLMLKVIKNLQICLLLLELQEEQDQEKQLL